MPARHDGAPGSTQTPSAERLTLVGHLAQSAARIPDEPAFTCVDFTENTAGHREVITWAELERRTAVMAGILTRAGAVGERVAVVAPQGIAYVIGFLGALRAGAIAVPLFPPHRQGHDERLVSALADARPACLLTTSSEQASVARFYTSRSLPGAPGTIAIDAPAPADTAVASDDGAEAGPRPEDCAYLQYTSGSTRTPTGVEITHANVAANVRQALEAFDIRRGRNHVVSWLPLFHDMGLVLAVAIPIISGVHSVITDPLAFVQRPVRWLRLLAEHPGAVTAAPDFAYGYCARRVRDQERAELTLQHVAVMINGSEQVRPETLTRFQQAFAASGVRPEMIRPSYGLAEATVFVSTSAGSEPPRVTAFDRELLGKGIARPAASAVPGTYSELVACGRPVGQEVVVADTTTCRRLPDGAVGEIWVRGPNVARGYWRSPARSAETFAAVLADDPSDASEALRWLRTGDLGAFHDGCLYITGRIKDLIIIDGTNHYPQDIEATVQQAHALIRYDHVAAFALTVDGAERLVIVAEHSRDVSDLEAERTAVARTVHDAVVTGHGAPVHDFVLAPPGTVPRTSSGKVARSAARRSYLTGLWSAPVDQPRAVSGRAE